MTDTPDTQTRPAPGAGHYALLLLVLAAATLLYVRGLGDYSLWDPWEPKYAQSITEMREQGDLITPRMNGKIRWTNSSLAGKRRQIRTSKTTKR